MSNNSQKMKTKITDLINSDLRVIAGRPIAYANPINVINGRSRLSKASRKIIIEARKPSEYSTGEMKALISYLKATTRWLPANPNKKSVRDRIDDTYVPLVLRTQNKKIANSIHGDGGFGIEETVFEKNFVIVEGVRGIGKTAFVNYWLTKRTAALEEKKLVWFRIDASKVHQSHVLRPKGVEFLFTDYMRVHTVYVVLLYGGLLQDIGDGELGTDNTSQIFVDLVKHLNVSANKQLTDVFNIFREEAEIVFRKYKNRSDYSQYIVHNIISVDDEYVEKRGLIKNILDEIVKFFNRKDFRFLLIIDGVDNISWTKRNRFYNQTCNKFGIILNNIEKDFGSNKCMMLAARPETIHEINISATGAIPGFNNLGAGKFHTAKIEPPPIDEILNKKLLAAENSNAFDVAREMYNEQVYKGKMVLPNELADIRKSTKNYALQMVRSISESYNHMRRLGHKSDSIVGTTIYEGTLDKNSLLQILYDNDVRAYIDNIIKVHFVTKKIAGRNKQRLGRWLLQFTFLNGRPFYDSKEHYLSSGDANSRANYTDRGNVFPNIFWWDVDATRDIPERWHGLVCIRIIQIIKTCRRPILGDVIFFLENMFGFKREVVIEAIEAMVAFGIIDIYDRATNNASGGFAIDTVLGDTVLREYLSVAKLTDKGTFLYEYLWCRPDIMYYFALDTPMSHELVEKRSDMVKACKEFDSLNFVEDYFQSAVPTIATLYLHVVSTSKFEKKLLLNKKDEKKYYSALFGSYEGMLNAFELPKYMMVFNEKFIDIAIASHVKRESDYKFINTINDIFKKAE